jgi:hypothetical protein
MNVQIAQPETPVHLFLDLSNITCGARDAAAREGDDSFRVRLHAQNLYRLMAAGRPVASATLVANAGVPEAVLARWRPLFTIVTAESGRDSGLDEAADEKLQNRLFLLLLRPEPPAIIVVATGDGAGWRRGIGFVPTLTAARRRGFGVEVLAFRNQLNPRLRALGNRAGVVVDLDRYYGRITFLEGLRGAQSVFLHHRATTTARPWRSGELDDLDEHGAGDAA